jgi:hypothetical protein
MSRERKESCCDKKQSLVRYAKQIERRRERNRKRERAVVRTNGTGYVK